MGGLALAQRVLERHPHAGALLDGRGRLVAVNPPFCALCNQDAHALLGKDVTLLLPECQLPWQQLAQLKNEESIVFNWIPPAFKAQQSAVTVRLEMLAAHENHTAAAMLLLCVPPPQRDERSLAPPVPLEGLRLDERYRLFFDLAPLGMFTSTTTGRFLEVNRALASMLGFDSPQQVLEQVQDIASDIYVDPSRRHEIVGIIRRNPSFAHFENEYRRRDGSRFTAHLYVTVLEDGNNGSPCLLGVVEDITHRKHAEKELRISRELYQSIFENAPVGIYQSTLKGRYLNVNQEFANMFGFDSSEEVLREVADIGTSVYADPACRERMIAMLTEQGAVTNYEAHSRRKDGSLFWTMRNARLMCDQEGRPSHIKGFVMDISQQKELEKLREDVERITRHDIKSPILACIFGVRMLQREDNLTPRQVELLGEMEKSGHRMLAMINLSLDLYKMERGTYDLEPVELDILPILRQEARTAMDNQRHKGLQLEILLEGRPCGEHESFLVLAEDLLCRSMFMNLLQNATDASPKEGVLRISLERCESMACISIHNQGAVPAAIRKRLFEKYVTAGKRHGTGLGAYSARLIARTHKGDIVCESSQERGTLMRVSLPLV